MSVIVLWILTRYAHIDFGTDPVVPAAITFVVSWITGYLTQSTFEETHASL